MTKKIRKGEKFEGLTALFFNTTLKSSPEQSHTDGLIRISKAIMQKNGVKVSVMRPVDMRFRLEYVQT